MGRMPDVVWAGGVWGVCGVDGVPAPSGNSTDKLVLDPALSSGIFF